MVSPWLPVLLDHCYGRACLGIGGNGVLSTLTSRCINGLVVVKVLQWKSMVIGVGFAGIGDMRRLFPSP